MRVRLAAARLKLAVAVSRTIRNGTSDISAQS
jgi:hypothetical protein